MPNARFEGRLHHMLVVEDSVIIAMDLESSLEDLGIGRITVAADVELALRAVDAGGIDAALVDVFLDKEDGLVVADRLAGHGIPFALMTGLGASPTLQAQFPGAPILAKPFSGEELVATVELLCR